MPVNWGNSLVVNPRRKAELEPGAQLWVDLARPRASEDVVGNAGPVKELNDWFARRHVDPSGDACLVVKGPSGVGKSTVVNLCATEHGFDVVHTYANVPRTPQKMESILRQLTIHGGPSVLILDDFESFISETTSMRDIVKFARAAVGGKREGKASADLTLVIICNETDKSFQPLFNFSKVIEFDSPSPEDVGRVLHRLARRVSGWTYIPPMDIFFVAHGSGGNICQTINQLQLAYTKTARPGKKRQKTLNSVQAKPQKDSAFKSWSITHRSASIECFVTSDDKILDSIWAMSREFHLDVRNNLHRDYPLYFHSMNAESLESTWRVSEEVSASDTYVPEEEDALYSTENSECWARDNSFAVAHMSRGIWQIRGRKRGQHCAKKRRNCRKLDYP